MKILTAVKKMAVKLSRDNITGYAAQSCYYIVLSLLPFIILLLTLIQFISIEASTLSDILHQLTPRQLHEFLDSIVNDLFQNSSVTITFVSAVSTLWAAGKGFMSLMNGFNTIYEIKETRHFLLQRVMASFYTLIFLVLIVCSLFILIFGNKLMDFLSGKFPNVHFVINSIVSSKYIIFPCMLMLFFMAIFKFLPNKKTSMLRELPGAVLASAGWFVFSYGFSVYVDNASNFSYTYGSLGTFIILLIWLYSCMLIMFFGAEFNTFINKKIIGRHLFEEP